jgi:nucleotide-binding universal stress UspA family protein
MQPRILVPFDFNEPAARALAWAADLVRSVGGGTIKVIHLVDNLPAEHDLRTVPLLPTAEERAELSRKLSAVVADLAPGALTELVLASDFGAAIVDAAKAWPAELIAMGTHGRGIVGRLVLGSVADHVVRHASCPVVTMRNVTSSRLASSVGVL